MHASMRCILPMLTLSITLGYCLPGYTRVTVEEPWVRATLPQQATSAAFIKLTADQAMYLVHVSSPAAKTVEIHEMSIIGDIMKMRPIKRLELVPHQTVNLKPGSYHLMLLGLVNPLKAGEHIPLTLTFENVHGTRETLQVKAEVLDPAMLKQRKNQDLLQAEEIREHAQHQH